MHTYQQTLFDQQIHPSREQIKAGILEIVKHEPPMKARQIAYRLSKKFGTQIRRHDVNSVVYHELRHIVLVLKPNYIIVFGAEDSIVYQKPHVKPAVEQRKVTQPPISAPVTNSIGMVSLPQNLWNPRRLIGRAIRLGYAFLAFEIIKFFLGQN